MEKLEDCKLLSTVLESGSGKEQVVCNEHHNVLGEETASSRSFHLLTPCSEASLITGEIILLLA